MSLNSFRVFRARENQTVIEIINSIVNTYDLDKNLLRITCAGAGEEFSPAKLFPDIKEKLREVRIFSRVSSTRYVLHPSQAHPCVAELTW